MLKNLPFTLSSLRSAYSGDVTPQDIVEEVYARIARVDDPAIFLHLLSKDSVLAAADALGPPSSDQPLWGIPFVIKDNIDAAGLPTTAACPSYSRIAEEDAFVVSRLKRAGALLIGKTNLDQFATGLVGTRSPYGIPRNSVAPHLVPGGSSSGSAVAVGHGIVPFSLGTDTAGSGRVPAAMNNIVGLKPTIGLLSASGMTPACRTLDTISIFAQTVDDAYEIFSHSAGYDASDPYARSGSLGTLGEMPPGLRIGIPDTATIRLFGDDLQRASFDAAIERLTRQGATIVPMDFSIFYEIADLLYEGAWVAERYNVIEPFLTSAPESVLPVTRGIVEKAEALNAVDVFRDFYQLQELRRQAEAPLQSVDLLCVPTIPTFYSLADLEADPVGPNSRLGTYTNFVNLIDMCGIAVPTGLRKDGLPGSVTLLAPAFQDDFAATVARAFSGIETDSTTTAPPSVDAVALSDCARDGEFELAVCGAHMSGLPLNRQLTSLGARFLREDRTAARYEFFALAGGPPERPGLVRVPEGDGFEIELEIWGLPVEAVGQFISGIPAPLAIGTLELSSGASVHGFVCEAAGAENARDISHLGGWRSYLEAV